MVVLEDNIILIIHILKISFGTEKVFFCYICNITFVNIKKEALLSNQKITYSITFYKARIMGKKKTEFVGTNRKRALLTFK